MVDDSSSEVVDDPSEPIGDPSEVVAPTAVDRTVTVVTSLRAADDLDEPVAGAPEVSPSSGTTPVLG